MSGFRAMAAAFVVSITVGACAGGPSTTAPSLATALAPASAPGAEISRARRIARTLCKYEPTAAVVVKVGAAVNPVFGLAATNTAHLTAVAICDAVNGAGGAQSLRGKAIQVYGVPLAGRVIERVRARRESIKARLARQG